MVITNKRWYNRQGVFRRIANGLKDKEITLTVDREKIYDTVD